MESWFFIIKNSPESKIGFLEFSLLLGWLLILGQWIVLGRKNYLKENIRAGYWLLRSVILATQEAESRGITL
jgi:hypothetical protein